MVQVEFGALLTGGVVTAASSVLVSLFVQGIVEKRKDTSARFTDLEAKEEQGRKIAGLEKQMAILEPVQELLAETAKDRLRKMLARGGK